MSIVNIPRVMSVATKMKPDFGGLTPKSALDSVEYAAQQIRDAIVSGRLSPGTRLIEARLTDQLNVSRHPVREALKRLSREGFVEVRPNRGAIVAEINPESILEVYALRSSLGSIALGALAKKPELLTGAVLRNLERLARNAQRFAKESDQEVSINNHLEFQDAIVKASNLEKTARYFEELTAEVIRFNNLLKMSYTDREKDAEERIDALAKALKEKDFVKAERIWRQSFTLAAERFIDRVALDHGGRPD
ncbi:GntR family transcriptional regulator [Caballeronia sp. GAFFF2]|uniref:GntR family transcriptional regulator n=1 Tax=Caballeronia sp. GAFFF2 TaxID=2921741 RepID=UPI0020287C2F|nr:GntR family transcriptional regulator [Caballeronia sp. GAFFF2]